MLISVFLMTLSVNHNLQCMMLVLVPRRMERYQLEENVEAAAVQHMAAALWTKENFNSGTWNPPPLSSLMYIHMYNRRGGVFCEGVLSQRCCWWQCSRNNFKAQLELLARWCLLPAPPAGHSPGRMGSRSNGAQGTPETWSKMKNPTLAFVFTPWRSISTNRNLSNTKRRFAAAFILLPF